jgi:ferredoxin
MRPMEESERKAKLDAQLGAMAAAPVKRRRRVVKPLSTTPTPVPAAVQFTDDATTNEDANETKEDTKKEDDDNDDAAEAAEECPTDGCSSDDDLWNGESVDFQSMDENEKRAYAAFAARKTRGYQSDRHSTESAHSRLNGQLAGLHRKKVIRQRATGEIDLEDFKKDFKKNGGTGNKSAARRDGRDHEGTGLSSYPNPASLFAHTTLTLSFIYRSARRNKRRAVLRGGGGCSWRRARLSGSCGSRSSPGSGASNGR